MYNSWKQLLIKKSQEYEYRTWKPAELVGFDFAWKTAFQNVNRAVREEAQSFIINKYYYDDELNITEWGANNREFVTTWESYMKETQNEQ